jgi:hypothetical protein
VATISEACRAVLPESLRSLPSASKYADLQAILLLPPIDLPEPTLEPNSSSRAASLPPVPRASTWDATHLEAEAVLVQGLEVEIPPYAPAVARIDVDALAAAAPADWTPTQHLLARLMAEDYNVRARSEVNARLRWRQQVLEDEIAYREEYLTPLWRAAQNASATRHTEWTWARDRARRSRRVESAIPPLVGVASAIAGFLLLGWSGTRSQSIRVTAHTVTIGRTSIPMHDIARWDGATVECRSGGQVSLGDRVLAPEDRTAVRAAIELGRSTPRETRPGAQADIERLVGS